MSKKTLTLSALGLIAAIGIGSAVIGPSTKADSPDGASGDSVVQETSVSNTLTQTDDYGIPSDERMLRSYQSNPLLWKRTNKIKLSPDFNFTEHFEFNSFSRIEARKKSDGSFFVSYQIVYKNIKPFSLRSPLSHSTVSMNKGDLFVAEIEAVIEERNQQWFINNTLID